MQNGTASVEVGLYDEGSRNLDWLSLKIFHPFRGLKFFLLV